MTENKAGRPIDLEARKRRAYMSAGETKLWTQLCQLNRHGWHFLRMKTLGDTIADFYLGKSALIIEVDNDGRDLPAEYEQARMQYYAYRRFQVIRFTQTQILNNPSGVTAEILAAAESRFEQLRREIKTLTIQPCADAPAHTTTIENPEKKIHVQNPNSMDALPPELSQAYRDKDISILKAHAENLLRQMVGETTSFRSGQWEAIETLAIHRQRALVVQRTGWGKSMVYFLSTRMLREQGYGPTLLVSPLLSLMRNQIEAANRIGITALTINSANREEWDKVEALLTESGCDLLLVSPERLSNSHFLREVMPRIGGNIGLFVVDEAHCISDWGHDFRPDYRRITRILQLLPKGVPVLGTTATANDRVAQDVQSQMGSDITVLRGSLDRESLRLQNITLETHGERLAWLAENLPTLLKAVGSGIIYCLTVADTEQVTSWLKQKGFQAEAYYADAESRPELEEAFLRNEIPILVATVALGMGFDKPDIGFVVHYQRPPSVIAYYQQVGRAGRAIQRSYGIMLNGKEDDDVAEYFIQSAFPSISLMVEVLTTLEQTDGMTISEMLSAVNVNRGMLEKALRMLQVDGAVVIASEAKKTVYFRTPNPWQPDPERIAGVMKQRHYELAQMQEYAVHRGCLMQFLRATLDDPQAVRCGRCANCHGKGFSAQVSAELILEAEEFLNSTVIPIEPRKQAPVELIGANLKIIPVDLRLEPGRCLCNWGDSLGRKVSAGKYQHGRFSDDLINRAVNLICKNWRPNPPPQWVAAIPSLRHIDLVPDLASRLAERLGLPFFPVLKRTHLVPEQKTMQNSSMQARNVQHSLTIEGSLPSGPVLLVDDIIDSGWTLTMAGYLLRSNGSGPVYPFALARAAMRNSK